MAGFRNYDILVVDEVGRQVNRFENEADLLFQIVDTRYQAGKSTVFATNIAGKKLGSCFNEATASRLKAFNRLIYCDSQDIPDQRISGEKIHTA
jgi:DNA replication protein DnaC